MNLIVPILVFFLSASARGELSNSTNTTTAPDTVTGLGSHCGAAANCMSVKYSECINQTCVCMAGLKPLDGACVMGGNCTVSANCSKIASAVCEGGACKCPGDHFFHNKQCSKRQQVGDKCEKDGDCLTAEGAEQGASMQCRETKCQCKAQYSVQGSTCVKSASSLTRASLCAVMLFTIVVKLLSL